MGSGPSPGTAEILRRARLSIGPWLPGDRLCCCALPPQETVVSARMAQPTDIAGRGKCGRPAHTARARRSVWLRSRTSSKRCTPQRCHG